MPENTEWRPVPDYESLYEANTNGQIRSLDHEVPSRGGTRMVRGKLLKQFERPDGYLQICLSKNGSQRWFTVHSVIAATFIGPRPAGMDVCHGDGNGSNNRLRNLRYDTKSANIRDSVKHGTHAEANATHCAQGHKWTPENTYRPPSGKRRYCRACRRHDKDGAAIRDVTNEVFARLRSEIIVPYLDGKAV